MSGAEVAAGWRSALTAWLQAHKSYPEAARREGEEGRVIVRFTVDRDGQVVGVAVTQGSGWQVLDDAAQAILRGARVPAFPPGMSQDKITVTLPIRYSMKP